MVPYILISHAVNKITEEEKVKWYAQGCKRRDIAILKTGRSDSEVHVFDTLHHDFQYYDSTHFTSSGSRIKL